MDQHPNFAIIGAPKSGTSSVHFWLSQFEEINASTPKETFFFIDEDCPMKNKKCNFHEHGIEAYRSFFNDTDSGSTLDSTTHYIYQQTAREQFGKANTKVLAILRDPVRRVVSYFQYLCLTKSATRTPLDFGDYVNHLLGGDVEKLRPLFYMENKYYPLAMAADHGQYIEHLDRWTEHVSREKLLVLTFEELVNQREATLQKIGQHFGVNPSAEQLACLPKENQTINVKSPMLNRLARGVGRLIPGEHVRKRLRDIYFKIQRKETPDLFDLYPEQLRRLVKHFEPYNQRLAESFQLDLSPWYCWSKSGAPVPASSEPGPGR